MAQTLDKFMKSLASADPAPGGGAAAALTAATGVGLLSMVAQINQKKEKKKEGKVSAVSSARAKKLLKLQAALLKSIDEDRRAFEKFFKVSTQGKDSAVYQKAVEQASEVPFKMCEWMVEATLTAQEEISRTSPWLASDLAEAAVLLKAAFRSAQFNIEVNLKLIKNNSFSESKRARVRSLFASAEPVWIQMEKVFPCQ